MALCQYCKAIPYHALPSEDEPGLPHQPTLPALVRSAQTCKLCELLLQCAYTTRSKIRQERCGGNDVPTGWTVTESSANGNVIVTELGQYNPGTEFFTPGHDASYRGLGLPGCAFVNSEKMKPWLYGSWWTSPGVAASMNAQSLRLIGIGLRLGTSAELVDGEGNSKETSYLRGTPLRVRALPETPAAAFIPGRVRTLSSKSHLALQQIRRWLGECGRHHDSCRPSMPVLPTRLLQAWSSPSGLRVRLVDTEGMHGRYIALSHCWGQQRRITTTTENIAARRAGIDMTTLPATFRDAAQLTHDLGLNLLWIDSLCILQNDRADWERESPRMAEVYSSAYITLSASHSDSSETGLFGPTTRPAPDQTPDNISLGRFVQGNVGPFLADLSTPPGFSALARCELVYATTYHYKGQRSDLLISNDWMPASTRRNPTPYISGGFGRPFDPLEKQHLQSRAWTLQERLLSFRMLHFAADQMYWECNECMTGEDGSAYSPDWYNMDLLLRGQRLPHSECGQLYAGLSLIEGYAPFDKSQRGRWRGGWLKHVEDYSGRSLTYESDRLVAMAGLAKQIAAETGDTYYAGLWRGHIIEDLCWRAYPVEEERRQVLGGFAHVYGKRLCRITAASSCRAPSWSWASLNGNVKFLPIDYSRLVAEVEACYVEPASELNLFGSAKSGWIKIKAPLLSLRKAPPNTEWNKQLPLGFGTLYEMHTPDGIALGEVYLDSEESPALQDIDNTSSISTGLSSLAISDDSREEKVVGADRKAQNRSDERPVDDNVSYHGLFLDSAHCLVLEQRPSSDEYKRVGLGKFLRTEEQIGAVDLKNYNMGTKTSLGPINPDHSRTVVRIV